MFTALIHREYTSRSVISIWHGKRGKTSEQQQQHRVSVGEIKVGVAVRFRSRFDVTLAYCDWSAARISEKGIQPNLQYE
ncbi:unnamed protein product [Acanthoscelides obtectus]|uniref:Uncharacterized protein n=1 Tax=Acanthoscelides obtectus TaxID=200917 RepID=A0A9P0JNS3_ACAOB|nr:unnamed protein product [Acanthoscelides obtectus]CAK1673825.1 hypothetical protein AOBTE_LOCUS29450 [Acanthoscelides obtectus]